MRYDETREPGEEDAPHSSHQSPEAHDLSNLLTGEEVSGESIQITAPELHSVGAQTNHGHHPENVVQIDREHSESHEDGSHQQCFEPSFDRRRSAPYQPTRKRATGNAAEQ